MHTANFRPLDVEGIRKDFPIFATDPPLAFLDNAASTQTPRPVVDAMDAYYDTYRSNIHRGIYRIVRCERRFVQRSTKSLKRQQRNTKAHARKSHNSLTHPARAKLSSRGIQRNPLISSLIVGGLQIFGKVMKLS